VVRCAGLLDPSDVLRRAEVALDEVELLRAIRRGLTEDYDALLDPENALDDDGQPIGLDILQRNVRERVARTRQLSEKDFHATQAEVGQPCPLTPLARM
jgi:hypothetical protein